MPSMPFPLASTNVPSQISLEKVLSHLNFMKNDPLYKKLQHMPKGTVHHVHFDCNEDPLFVFISLPQFKNHIINDPRIYLNA